jgi:hypothetical protein
MSSKKHRRKETKVQGSIYRDTKNVEYELCEYTGNNLSHRNRKKNKRKFWKPCQENIQ